MGATRNTGYLENLIQYDASDNVAIATSVNPSYKVTLGGSLLGTSAVFSSSVTSQVPNNTSVPQFSCVQTGGNTYGVIGINRNDGTGIATGLSSALVIRSGNATDYPIQFATANNIRMTITSGGDMYLTGRSTNGDYGMYFYSNDTDSRIYSSNSGAVSKSLIFYTSGTERLRIRSGGEVSFIPTTWTYVNPNTTYRNMDIGAAGFLYRDATDAYLLSNHYYNSSGQNIAKYTYSEGIGAFAFAGGNLTWYSYGASVTAGSSYATTPRFTVTYTGNVGIGTTSPSSLLHMVGASATLIVADNTSYAAGVGGKISFQGNYRNIGDIAEGGYIKASKTNATNGDYGFDMVFGTQNYTAGVAERMRLKNDGQLLMDQAGGNSWKLYINQQNLLGGENGIYVSSGYYPAIHLSGNSGTTGGGKWVINSFATGYGSGSLAGAMLLQSDKALQFSTNGDNVAMTITTGQNVLIGTTSDSGGRLQVSGGDVRVSGGIRFSSSGADANRWSVYWNGGTGDLIVVNNISDIRAKKDFDYNIKGLETIQKLKPLKFTWKDGISHSTSVSGRLRQYGFIAQETMEADDFLAWYNESQDSWGIEQYESFSAVIVKAIQEQQAQIEELKSKLS